MLTYHSMSFGLMNIHTAPWTAQSIKVKHDQYTEYFGIKNYLQGQPFVTQFNDTCLQLQQLILQQLIEDLYSSTKHQQYPPTFFSTVIHHTVFQAIFEISQILARGLIQIWRCKAATIHNQHIHKRRQSYKTKRLVTTSNTPPTSNLHHHPLL